MSVSAFIANCFNQFGFLHLAPTVNLQVLCDVVELVFGTLFKSRIRIAGPLRGFIRRFAVFPPLLIDRTRSHFFGSLLLHAAIKIAVLDVLVLAFIFFVQVAIAWSSFKVSLFCLKQGFSTIAGANCMPAGKRNSAHEKTPDCCDPRSDRQADWRVSEQKSDATLSGSCRPRRRIPRSSRSPTPWLLIPIVGSTPDHNVELGGELFRLIGEWAELGLYQLLLDRRPQMTEDAIFLLSFVSGDKDLRREQFTIAFEDFEMDVRRGAAWINDRLDGSEAILAFGIRFKPTEALEVLVLQFAAGTTATIA